MSITAIHTVKALGLFAAMAVLSVASASAQSSPSTSPASQAMPMAMAPAAPGPESASTQAFKAANDKMMQGMNIPMSGNPDQDFVAGMIPHHQGAVAMARTELQYGTNPEMLRLARQIVASQDSEIARMKAWQKAHPAK
jgi:uncharacterized protein (DUF305 family)